MDRKTIIEMSQEEYRSLDIAAFISANLGRYTRPLIRQYQRIFEQVDYNEIHNLVFIEAYEAILVRHRRHPNAVGIERTRLLMGMLKLIATTNVIRAFTTQFGTRLEVRLGSDFVDSSAGDKLSDEFQDDETDDFVERLADNHPMYAASESDSVPGADSECEQMEIEARDDRDRSMMIEAIRPHLSTREYQVLRLRVCGAANAGKIGEDLGITARNAAALLRRTRHRLLTIAKMQAVPRELISQPVNDPLQQ